MQKNELLSTNNEYSEYFTEDLFSHMTPLEKEKVIALIREKIFQSGGFLEKSPALLIDGEGNAENFAKALLQFAAAYSDLVKGCKCLNSYDKAEKFIKKLISDNDIEGLYMICLDENYNMIFSEKICEGDAGSVFIDVENMISKANGAEFVIIAHNHTSVYIRISSDDFHSTQKLSAYFEKSGIRLLEHFVVSKSNTKGILKELTGKNNWKC